MFASVIRPFCNFNPSFTYVTGGDYYIFMIMITVMIKIFIYLSMSVCLSVCLSIYSFIYLSLSLLYVTVMKCIHVKNLCDMLSSLTYPGNG